MNLPLEYENRMKKLLGNEYCDYQISLSRSAYRGIRLNTLKCSSDILLKHIDAKQSPFSPYSYYIDDDFKPGTDPLHRAGAYYVQEPSASATVTILNPQKGDIVLDLCAAPGGKSSHIAEMLGNEGIIWSNEIIRDRAGIIVSNFERLGIKNAVITNDSPEMFQQKVHNYFNKILVDAPCSGEGMFRKNPEAIKYWSEENVKACAKRQLAILNTVSDCLKENGELVYSTCTFSLEENENVILEFLDEHHNYQLVPITAPFGRKAFGLDALRIFPMDGGEGHFVAKLKKIKSDNNDDYRRYKYKNEKPLKNIIKQIDDVFNISDYSNIYRINDSIYELPDGMPEIYGFNLLRCGILLGKVHGDRFEPEYSGFMSKKVNECRHVLSLDYFNRDLYKFYRGEEIESNQSGFTAVAVENIVTGHGKSSSGILKNKYPKGLRSNI
jgi:NOL1/NOP2/sun family putative RNA methylase